MKEIIRITLFFLFVFASQNIEAQSIARSTLCGAGATMIGNSGALTSTFGQCPGCGTLSSGTNTLTQGFQQPSPDTCISVTFEYLETIDNCGTTYSFNYTGDANTDEVIFAWDFGSNGFPQTSDLANPQGVAFGGAGLVTIHLQVLQGDCDLMDSIVIDVPAIGFSANAIFTDTIACFGDANGSIELELNGGSQPFVYQWSNGEQTASISDLPAGDYTYTITDANDCKVINTVTLDGPEEVIDVDAVIQSETCDGDRDGSLEVTVNGGTSPYILQWNTGGTNSSLIELAAGNYTLTVTDANDCVGEFDLAIGQMCELVIDDVLSPNGDGANETWGIQGINQYPNNEVAIFNRWGQQIWHTKAYNNDWIGVNDDGETLPIGAYFYVLKLNDPDDQVFSGSVTLVR